MSSSFEFDPDKMEGSGLITRGTAGENLGNRRLIYMGNDGNWYHADADAVATMPVIGITLNGFNIGQRGQILHHGYIGLATWTWTVGGEVYASTTAGELTQTPPAGPADVVQFVGIATNQRILLFAPMPPSGTSFGQTKEVLYKVSNPNANVGQHDAAQMLDGVDTTIPIEIMIPADFNVFVDAHVIVVQTGTVGAVNVVWTAVTDFARICVNEAYDTHQDTGGATSTITQNELECLDISGALTGLSANDWIGLEFTRDGDNIADTVGAPVYFIGVRVRYR